MLGCLIVVFDWPWLLRCVVFLFGCWWMVGFNLLFVVCDFGFICLLLMLAYLTCCLLGLLLVFDCLYCFVVIVI